MSSLYARSALSPFTRANAEQVNAELTKIQAAIDALQGNIADIVAGTPIASYTWIAFANSADGSDDFTTGDANGRLYIGFAYNRGSPIKSEIYTDYEWNRIRGEDGIDATSGADGLSIVEKYVYKRAVSAPATPTGGSFNFSTQATTAPAGWSTGVPSGTDPVWVSVAVATKQGTGGSVGFGTWSAPALAFTSGADGADGEDGAPGSSVDVIFRRSATQPATPGAGLSTPAGWYTNVAAVPVSSDPLFSSFGNRASPTSNWIWNTPVLVEGQPGLDGNDGIDGADGKLIEFVWKRNATQPATPTGNGIPSGWTDDPPAGSDPLWMSKAKQELDGTLVIGETWSAPVRHDGPPGANGSPGANGLSNAVIYLYQRGASAPSAPSGTFTYTFATGVLSGGTLNGWSQAIPAANGNPLWVIAATASANTTTDSVAAAEFTSPVLKDGAGLNSATVFLYQRAASTPSVPGSTLTYTFSTGVLSGTLGSWSQSVPANNGNPVYIITATALGTSTTDAIASGEWSTPQILASNGANGSNGSDGAPGRDAITYVQDTTPTGTFVVNDTWYAPTAKVWKRWNGSAWVQILGNVASFDVITGTYIAADTIVASHFLTDQGVDLAAIVNGALNTAVTATQGSTINLPIVLNAPNTNDAAVATTGNISVVNAGDSIFVNGSVTATNGTNRGAYQLQVSVDGGAWTTLQEISSSSTQIVAAGTYTFSMEYQNVVAGTTLAFRILAEQRAAQSTGDGTAGTNWTTNAGSIRVRRFFSK